jgi:hypothetical protein
MSDLPLRVQDNYLVRFLRTTGRVLTLRTSPMDAYVWPAWLSWAVLMLVDAYVSAGLSTRVESLEIWALRSVVTTFLVYSICAHLISWYMRLGDRWDGKGGTMLNLLAATTVAELIPGTVQKFDLPQGVVLGFWFIPLIVTVRALTGVGRAGVGYCLGGTLLLSLPAALIRSFGQ